MIHSFFDAIDALPQETFVAIAAGVFGLLIIADVIVRRHLLKLEQR